MRIEKLLANNNTYSRSDIKKMLSKGKIKVNGEMIKTSIQVDVEKDIIWIEGKLFQKQEEYIYIMLNKPKGYVCANKDNLHKTVFELLDEKYLDYKDLHTLGRLDLDTEGLLIITNDGQLTHDLLSPNKHVKKIYEVEVDKDLEIHLIEQFKNGIDIKEKKLTKESKLIINNKRNCTLEISEGKFHQVKRMFKAFDYNVINLKRIQINNLVLPQDLAIGAYKIIKKEEI